MTPPPRASARSGNRSLPLLSLGALGVVFGDIGTSPLYALKACFAPEYGLAPTPDNVKGIVSLILWALTLIVTIKYVAYIMRADNHGEGGIFALLALLVPVTGSERKKKPAQMLVILGLIGAALLYGDGVITPAISVLSAVEGIRIATPAFTHLIVPLSLAILVVLFGAQRYGSGKLGNVFGPLMLLWFGVLGVVGARELLHASVIWEALNPMVGAIFLREHGLHGVLVLGAVVLAVTGAEALYADMGHFGKRPIRMAWMWVVFPSLVLNYLGQGALLIRVPAAVDSPFYLLAPSAVLLPFVVLATFATVVASQALIAGAFSLTQQAMQLGYVPRMRTTHTSATAEGQIYIPLVNVTLMVLCLLLVVGFRSSDRLAAAYGIAVTGTMAVTSVLFYAIARARWGWSRLHAGVPALVFLVVDLTFFGTNLVKFLQGGWVPVTFAAAVFLVMTTWRAGHDCVLESRRGASSPLEEVFRACDSGEVVRVPGTGVFFTAHGDGAPAILLRQMRHMKALHEVIVLLTLTTTSEPEVVGDDRLTFEQLSHGFTRAAARVGFMQTPDAPGIIRELQQRGHLREGDAVYFLSHDRIQVSGTSQMATWRKHLFQYMMRNVSPMADSLGIPPPDAVELGGSVQL